MTTHATALKPEDIYNPQGRKLGATGAIFLALLLGVLTIRLVLLAFGGAHDDRQAFTIASVLIGIGSLTAALHLITFASFAFTKGARCGVSLKLTRWICTAVAWVVTLILGIAAGFAHTDLGAQVFVISAFSLYLLFLAPLYTRNAVDHLNYVSVFKMVKKDLREQFGLLPIHTSPSTHVGYQERIDDLERRATLHDSLEKRIVKLEGRVRSLEENADCLPRAKRPWCHFRLF